MLAGESVRRREGPRGRGRLPLTTEVEFHSLFRAGFEYRVRYRDCVHEGGAWVVLRHGGMAGVAMTPLDEASILTDCMWYPPLVLPPCL